MLPEEFSKEMWDCWRDVAVAYSAFAKNMGVDTSELYVVDALLQHGHLLLLPGNDLGARVNGHVVGLLILTLRRLLILTLGVLLVSVRIAVLVLGHDTLS